VQGEATWSMRSSFCQAQIPGGGSRESISDSLRSRASIAPPGGMGARKAASGEGTKVWAKARSGSRGTGPMWCTCARTSGHRSLEWFASDFPMYFSFGSPAQQ
jgi:hypothetical protein